MKKILLLILVLSTLLFTACSNNDNVTCNNEIAKTKIENDIRENENYLLLKYGLLQTTGSKKKIMSYDKLSSEYKSDTRPLFGNNNQNENSLGAIAKRLKNKSSSLEENEDYDKNTISESNTQNKSNTTAINIHIELNKNSKHFIEAQNEFNKKYFNNLAVKFKDVRTINKHNELDRVECIGVAHIEIGFDSDLNKTFENGDWVFFEGGKTIWEEQIKYSVQLGDDKKSIYVDYLD